MKWLSLMAVVLLVGCSQQPARLSASEIEQIKNEIIKRSEKHAENERGVESCYSPCLTYPF